MTPQLPRGEKRILLKNVPLLDCFDYRPTYLRVWRWVKYGVRGVFLEAKNEGGRIHTTVPAVERFIAKTNGATR